MSEETGHIDLGTVYKKLNDTVTTLESTCGISMDAPSGNINIKTLRKEFDDLGTTVDEQSAYIDLLNDDLNTKISLITAKHETLDDREEEHYTGIVTSIADHESRIASNTETIQMLMMETGLRIGECLALTWNDVLWERRAIRVSKTLIRIANRHRMEVQDGAKSFTSNRTIPLSTNAYNLLDDLSRSSEKTNGYIFAADDGFPISYEAMRYQIQQACEEADVPYLGQHVFRHTFATNCYNRGCDVKILSKLLGHADVAVTYNVYIHLFGDALEEMRSVVG